ncbi:hypothetical protein FDECE_4451 [Fusarium decemcellulare]|nr:hypothetical protein FDECE_4451 [Fusarium decemcellulare]
MVTLFHPDVDWKPYQTLLLYLLLLLIPVALNLKPEILPVYSTVGAVFTVLGFFAWAITMLVTAPKSDATFVFTTFLNNSGYGSNAWVFILGFYNPLYGLYGTDSMMHLVEEMKNAAKDAPRAMVWSMIFSGVMTLITDLVLLFCCGNYDKYATALSPYVDWFSDMSGSSYGGIFIAVTFGVVNIPFNFMLVMVGVEVLIGLISLGSDLAFNAIVSGAGVCFTIAYALPVLVVSTSSETCESLCAHGKDRLLFEAGQSSHLAPILILETGDYMFKDLIVTPYHPCADRVLIKVVSESGESGSGVQKRLVEVWQRLDNVLDGAAWQCFPYRREG